MGHKEYRKLHAEWYVLMSGKMDSTRELDFWTRKVNEAGEPALELGSGTGRVLIPLLERGIEVIGIDNSEDMTAECLKAGKVKGVTPEVHEQSILEFDLGREFGLIFLDSGGLGLFTRDEEIQAAFGRVMAHLKPGGSFIYEFEPAAEPFESDANWSGDWVKGPDGEILAWRNCWKRDLETHTWETLFVVEKYVDGRLVEAETNEREGRKFTVEEAMGFALSAGFEGIRATDWLTDDPPNDESQVITVECHKPS